MFDVIGGALFFWWLIYSFAHFYRLDKALTSDGRKFRSSGVSFSSILFLPWAMRQAEKEFIREQEERRNSNK